MKSYVWVEFEGWLGFPKCRCKTFRSFILLGSIWVRSRDIDVHSFILSLLSQNQKDQSNNNIMICTPTSAAANSRNGFLYLINNNNSSSSNSMSGMSSYRSCAIESSASAAVSFSWSDFPILGQGSTMNVVPHMLEMETVWCNDSCKGSSSTGSCTTCSTSDDDSSLSCQSSLSISTLEEEAIAVSKKDDRKVSFSNVLCIRTYEVTLGDHPCCVGGMALTCGWAYAEDDECIDLDVYERYAPKRPMRELRLSYHERRCRLQAATGLSPAELLQLEYNLVCEADNTAPVRLLQATGSVKSFRNLSV